MKWHFSHFGVLINISAATVYLILLNEFSLQEHVNWRLVIVAFILIRFVFEFVDKSYWLDIHCGFVATKRMWKNPRRQRSGSSIAFKRKKSVSSTQHFNRMTLMNVMRVENFLLYTLNSFGNERKDDKPNHLSTRAVTHPHPRPEMFQWSHEFCEWKFLAFRRFLPSQLLPKYYLFAYNYKIMRGVGCLAHPSTKWELRMNCVRHSGSYNIYLIENFVFPIHLVAFHFISFPPRFHIHY